MTCPGNCAGCPQTQDLLLVGSLVQCGASDVVLTEREDNAPEDYMTPEFEEPEPEPEAPTASGWPAPAVPRADLWYVSPTEGVRYMLSPNYTDTLSGLAKTYLGSYTRWREIYALNPNPAGPAGYMAGSFIRMPDEAIANAIRRGFLPNGAGGVDVSEYGTGADLTAGKDPERSRLYRELAIGAASAAAGAATAALVTKAIG